MKASEKKSSFTIFYMIAATLFAKLLGMARNMIFAWIMGDSQEAVAFAAASKIPGAIFDMLLSAAILGCFIPAYNALRETKPHCADGFASSFFLAAISVCALLSAAGIIFAPQIIRISTPGISKDIAALSSDLLRIMFPMMIFTAGAYTLTGILQSIGAFIFPAAISAVSNLFIIAYLLICRNSFSVYGLAVIYVISWFLQLATLSVPLIAKKKMPSIISDIRNSHLKDALKNAPQVIMGSWFAPVSLLIAAFFSSFVSDTAFLTYDYAIGIYTIVSGITVYGVGNYIFPKLSSLFAKGDTAAFALNVKKSLFQIAAITAPIFSAVSVLAYEGIALLYMRGNFSAELASDCAHALSALTFAMPAYALSDVLCRTFYAAGKAVVPMHASICAIAAAVISNCFSLFIDGGVLGISISYAIAQWCHTVYMCISARCSFGNIFNKRDALLSASLTLSCILTMLTMYIIKKNIPLLTSLGQTASLLFKITIVFIPSLMIYLLYIFIIFYFAKKRMKRGEAS